LCKNGRQAGRDGLSDQLHARTAYLNRSDAMLLLMPLRSEALALDTVVLLGES